MKEVIEAEGTVELGKAVDLLEDLLRGLKQGSVHVEYGDKQMTLVPSSVVAIECEAKLKKGKQKLSLEMTWADKLQAQADFGLKISSVPLSSDGDSGGTERDPMLFRTVEV